MDLLAAAVRNNVVWCDVVCRGVRDEAAGTWTTVAGAPAQFPDLVTLGPGVLAEEVARVLADRPTCSVKDSYADVDLTPHGFEVLFDARWLTLPATASDVTDDWVTVVDETELSSWCAAAGVPALPVMVLHDPTVLVCGQHRYGVITGGAIVNSSGGVVGLSNVFGDDVWPIVTAMAAQHFPQRPVVGYEHGADLDAALAAGFVDLGPLRVWVRPPR